MNWLVFPYIFFPLHLSASLLATEISSDYLKGLLFLCSAVGYTLVTTNSHFKYHLNNKV